MSEDFDVVILGAGASGLYCAMHAARRGRSVVVLDHGRKAGRKIRVCGGGKANFTNLTVDADNYICNNPHFVKSALARHSNWDVISFFAERGISYEERDHGQLFTLEGAGRLAAVLADECRTAGADVRLGREIKGVTGGERFRVDAGGETLTARKLVLALGGPSWPQVGATDLGFRLARQFALPLVDPRPALVPLVLSKRQRALCADLAGNSLPASVSCNGRSFTDPLLFTHKGFSGPAILQISSYWRPGDTLTVDFLPGGSAADLVDERRTSNMRVGNLLGRVLPKRLPPVILAADLAATPVSQLSKAQVGLLEERIHRFRVTPASTEGYGKAEATVGGVDTDATSSKTFETVVPGLHVVGELLDVTGQLGGYNLQWAFSSGAACGESL